MCRSQPLSQLCAIGWARHTEQLAVAGAAALDPDTATGSAAALLKTAADKQALVPKGEIFKAIKALDKAKLKVAADNP
jgi:hypothetical protein